MDVIIRDTFITMAQFLKKVNLISSGGEAKYFLTTVYISLNGIQEQRRGKKLYPGDILIIQEKSYTIQGSNS